MALSDEYEYDYENFTSNYDEDFTLNYTEALDAHLSCLTSHSLGLGILLPLLYSLIFFSGFVGNLFVICVVGSRGKRGGRLVDTFIINLALADLVFVLSLPLWAVSAARNNSWNFGNGRNFLCKLSSYVIGVNRYANVLFLTCMSVDRYVAVVRLLDSRYLRSSRCVGVACAGVWLTSLLLGVPSIVYRDLVELGGDSFCMDRNDSTFFLCLTLSMTLLTFVFPIVIVAFCYGTIISHLSKHSAATANPRTEARRRHSLKMVLAIIIAFVLSWLPYNVFKTMTTVRQLTEDAREGCDRALVLGHTFSSCLAFVNSCVNPVLYVCLDQTFRFRARALLHRCTGKAKSLHGHSSSSNTNGATSESATGGKSPAPNGLH